MRVAIHCQGCAGKVKKHISKMEGKIYIHNSLLLFMYISLSFKKNVYIIIKLYTCNIILRGGNIRYCYTTQ